MAFSSSSFGQESIFFEQSSNFANSTIPLAGAVAFRNNQLPNDAASDGSKITINIQHTTVDTEWETVRAVYNHAAQTLTRSAGDVIDGSSGVGTLVTFSPGTKRISFGFASNDLGEVQTQITSNEVRVTSLEASLALTDAAVADLQTGVVTMDPGDNNTEKGNKLAAGGHIVLTPGAHNLGFAAGGSLISPNPLMISAAVPESTTVTFGGTPLSLGPTRYMIENTLVLKDLNIIDSAGCFGIDGLDNPIPMIDLDNVLINNVGALFLSSTPTTSVNAVLSQVRARRCRAESSTYFIALNLGDPVGGTVCRFRYGFFESNTFTDMDGNCLAINYGNPDPNYIEGYAVARDNVVNTMSGKGISTVTAFGINLSAVREWDVFGGSFSNVEDGVRAGLECIYSKSPSTGVHYVNFFNAHLSNEGGGAVAFKGTDNGQVVERADLIGCSFRGDSQYKFKNATWFQSPGRALFNQFDGYIRAPIGTHNVTPIEFFHAIGNYGIFDQVGSESGVPYAPLSLISAISGEAAGAMPGDVRLEDNHCIVRSARPSGTFRGIILRSNNQTTTNALLKRNNIIRAAGVTGAAVQGISIEPQGSGQIINPQLIGNHGDNLDNFILFQNNAVTGAAYLDYNTSLNCTTDVNENGTGSVITENRNRWNP